MIDLKQQCGDRYRIELDPSADDDTSHASRRWLYRIPCKYGFIGVWSSTTLVAYCRTNRLLPRLLEIAGVQFKQRGDQEANLTFPPEAIDAVAGVLGARKKRRLSESQREAAMVRLAKHQFSRSPALETASI